MSQSMTSKINFAKSRWLWPNNRIWDKISIMSSRGLLDNLNRLTRITMTNISGWIIRKFSLNMDRWTEISNRSQTFRHLWNTSEPQILLEIDKNSWISTIKANAIGSKRMTRQSRSSSSTQYILDRFNLPWNSPFREQNRGNLKIKPNLEPEILSSKDSQKGKMATEDEPLKAPVSLDDGDLNLKTI